MLLAILIDDSVYRKRTGTNRQPVQPCLCRQRREVTSAAEFNPEYIGSPSWDPARLLLFIRLFALLIVVVAVGAVLAVARPRGAMGRQIDPDSRPPVPPGWGARAGLDRLIPEAIEYFDNAVRLRDRAETIEPIGPSHVARRDASLDEARREAVRAIGRLGKALPHAAEFADEATMGELQRLVGQGAEGDEYQRAKVAIDLMTAL